MLTAAIIIITRNRPQELRTCVLSCLAQDFHARIVVFDDASDTPVQSSLTEFGERVEVIRSEEQTGCIRARARTLQECTEDILFWIDDDAYFSSRETLSRVVDEFASNQYLGGLGCAYIEPSRDNGAAEWTSEKAMEMNGRSIAHFTGCAAAMRRSAVLAVGGINEDLGLYGGEEKDVCIRLAAHGWSVQFLNSPPVVHTVSNSRGHREQWYYAMRNVLIFDMMYAPFPKVFTIIPLHALRLFFYKNWFPYFFWRLYVVGAGLLACIRYLGNRKAVSRDQYRDYCQREGHAPIVSPPDSPPPVAP